jgi:hypothetical protein
MLYDPSLTVCPENMEQYRQCIADLDLSIDQKDDLIGIVFTILSYFVDQAFHVQTDQITLRSASQSFNASLEHATLCHAKNQTERVKGDDVGADSKPVGSIEP